MKINTFLLILWLLNWAFADTDCPMNLNYVGQLSWDKSSCESAIIKSDCCQALRSLLGIGLAQYLWDASMFELPNNASADALWIASRTALCCKAIFSSSSHIFLILSQALTPAKLRSLPRWSLTTIIMASINSVIDWRWKGRMPVGRIWSQNIR